MMGRYCHAPHSNVVHGSRVCSWGDVGDSMASGAGPGVFMLHGRAVFVAKLIETEQLTPQLEECQPL